MGLGDWDRKPNSNNFEHPHYFLVSIRAIIECFHSRGQHLCKFIGTKESVCIRKEFNSHRTGLGHQHGRRFIVLGQLFWDIVLTSRENTL